MTEEKQVRRMRRTDADGIKRVAASAAALDREFTDICLRIRDEADANKAVAGNYREILVALIEGGKTAAARWKATLEAFDDAVRAAEVTLNDIDARAEILENDFATAIVRDEEEVGEEAKQDLGQALGVPGDEDDPSRLLALGGEGVAAHA